MKGRVEALTITGSVYTLYRVLWAGYVFPLLSDPSPGAHDLVLLFLLFPAVVNKPICSPESAWSLWSSLSRGILAELICRPSF